MARNMQVALIFKFYNYINVILKVLKVNCAFQNNIIRIFALYLLTN